MSQAIPLRDWARQFGIEYTQATRWATKRDMIPAFKVGSQWFVYDMEPEVQARVLRYSTSASWIQCIPPGIVAAALSVDPSDLRKLRVFPKFKDLGRVAPDKLGNARRLYSLREIYILSEHFRRRRKWPRIIMSRLINLHLGPDADLLGEQVKNLLELLLSNVHKFDDKDRERRLNDISGFLKEMLRVTELMKQVKHGI